MITIAVANSKGGTGKTTLSAALAVRAAKDSKRVAMVDLDPQKSLVQWWQRRGGPKADNPRVFEGVDTAADACERAFLDGCDFLFLDGPPAFLTVMQEMIETADFTLIPVKPSMADLLATQDAVAMATEALAAFLCVFNDVGPKEKVAASARQFLFSHKVPIATTEIVHRVSHITGMTVGKTAAEVNSGKDEKATNEIDRLWAEVKAAAIKAARARTKRKAKVNV
jgi:chromosome partitioning protein